MVSKKLEVRCYLQTYWEFTIEKWSYISWFEWESFVTCDLWYDSFGVRFGMLFETWWKENGRKSWIWQFRIGDSIKCYKTKGNFQTHGFWLGADPLETSLNISLKKSMAWYAYLHIIRCLVCKETMQNPPSATNTWYFGHRLLNCHPLALSPVTC